MLREELPWRPGWLFLELTEADVSARSWIAEKLELGTLIRTCRIHAASPEAQAVWANLTALDLTALATQYD